MTQKISELVDGELEGHEAAGAYSALQSGVEARDAWFRYHLISDAIHDTRLLSHGFSERVAALLAAEPTVIAPALRPESRRELPWYATRVAAGLAAVAFVGYATVTMLDQGAPSEVAKAPAPAAAAVAVAAPAPAPPTQAQRDYMLAHQGYSPRNGLLVRVSGKAPNKP